MITHKNISCLWAILFGFSSKSVRAEFLLTFFAIYEALCTFPCCSASGIRVGATPAPLHSGCESGLPCLVYTTDRTEAGLRPRLRNCLLLLAAKCCGRHIDHGRVWPLQSSAKKRETKKARKQAKQTKQGTAFEVPEAKVTCDNNVFLSIFLSH